MAKHVVRIRHIALLIGFLILVFILGTLAYRSLTNTSDVNPSSEVKSVLSDDSMREYTSPENNFTITMPGFPTITDSNYPGANEDIKLTTYSRSIENDSKHYSVEVHDYTASQPFNGKETAETKLAEMIKQTESAVLSAKNPGIHQNIETLDATYQFQKDGKAQTTYVRFLTKDNKIYAIILTGGSQAEFTSFANSLKLNT